MAMDNDSGPWPEFALRNDHGYGHYKTQKSQRKTGHGAGHGRYKAHRDPRKTDHDACALRCMRHGHVCTDPCQRPRQGSSQAQGVGQEGGEGVRA